MAAGEGGFAESKKPCAQVRKFVAKELGRKVPEEGKGKRRNCSGVSCVGKENLIKAGSRGVNTAARRGTAWEGEENKLV